MRKLLLLVLLGISIPRSQAQTIVDTFPGNTLNESYWTIGPVSSGDWFEVDNGLTLENRAHLTTKDGVFGSPLTIAGTVTFNSIEDYLTIALRFDGAYENVPYYESSSGVRVLFGPVLRNAAGNKKLRRNLRRRRSGKHKQGGLGQLHLQHRGGRMSSR